MLWLWKYIKMRNRNSTVLPKITGERHLRVLAAFWRELLSRWILWAWTVEQKVLNGMNGVGGATLETEKQFLLPFCRVWGLWKYMLSNLKLSEWRGELTFGLGDGAANRWAGGGDGAHRRAHAIWGVHPSHGGRVGNPRCWVDRPDRLTCHVKLEDRLGR